MSLLRSALFYLGYTLITVVWGTLSVLIGWLLPYRVRFAFIAGAWTRICLGWLKLTCGISHRVDGLHLLPTEPCVVLCRHESTWETLFLQTLLAPQTIIIKRELLWIPFFGWAMALNKPIAINRSSPRAALKRLITIGSSRLRENIWVVLFPEGTRMPKDEIGPFQAGGAVLATAAGCPIVVIAHNAGEYWPAHQFRKTAGIIEVKISAPIQSKGQGSKALLDQAKNEMQSLLDTLPRT